MDAAGLVEYEQVHIWNVDNGNRFTTYVIDGEADSGVICLNGAPPRQVSQGDLVIIAAFPLRRKGACAVPAVARIRGTEETITSVKRRSSRKPAPRVAVAF